MESIKIVWKQFKSNKYDKLKLILNDQVDVIL